MNLKVVIDTNIVVSALLTPHGKPAEILRLFSEGILHVDYSNEILEEYEDVLSRAKLKINPDKAKIFLDEIKQSATEVFPQVSTIALPDESDRIFYDAAKTAGATLITENSSHFPNELFIKTPSDFLVEFANLTPGTYM